MVGRKVDGLRGRETASSGKGKMTLEQQSKLNSLFE